MPKLRNVHWQRLRQVQRREGMVSDHLAPAKVGGASAYSSSGGNTSVPRWTRMLSTRLRETFRLLRS